MDNELKKRSPVDLEKVDATVTELIEILKTKKLKMIEIQSICGKFSQACQQEIGGREF